MFHTYGKIGFIRRRNRGTTLSDPVVATSCDFNSAGMAFDLKDETEVKEYIEKLGVEYRFGCYSEKNPEGKIRIFIGK